MKVFAEQIANLIEIVIDEIRYKIEKIFGGDLEFLSLLVSINAANKNQACIWCKYNKKNKYETEKEKEWLINRTIEWTQWF